MRVGMLTFHRAKNFGAALQCAALQQYISNNICECQIVDFVPNNSVPTRRGLYWDMLRMAKRTARNFIFPYEKKRDKCFDDFYKENYNLSPKRYYGDLELKKCPPSYDVVLSGSDQILNTTLSGVSESFYLSPWGSSVKKISYGSSFGRDILSEDEYRLICNELPSFQLLSTRERSAAKIISSRIGREVPVVVDPVFLLDQMEWEKKCKSIALSGGYVLVYAMEYSETMNYLLQQEIAKGKNIRLICGSQSAQKLSKKKVQDIGPGEFLSYIKHADYIITNSFHGTAFSIIFQKDFFCVAHSSRNVRLENLMNDVKMPNNIINTKVACYEQYIVNGRQAFEQLHEIIDYSRSVLKDSIHRAFYKENNNEQLPAFEID